MSGRFGQQSGEGFNSARLKEQLIGQVLDNVYRVDRFAGEGGMAIVFEGFHLSFEERVAIKVPKPEILFAAGVLERFRREAVLLRKINHEHIVRVYDVRMAEQSLQNLHYIVMEYVEADRLDNFLSENQDRLLVGNVIDYLMKAAVALDYAHHGGIIHRDIKPENILITKAREVPKVVDFGLARQAESNANLTQMTAPIFTPAYASPEQCSGATDLGAASDIYSFCMTIYRCLARRPPFDAKSPTEFQIAQIREAPMHLSERNGKWPKAVGDVLMRGLAKNPDERPPTAEHLVRQVSEALGPVREKRLEDFFDAKARSKTDVIKIKFVEDAAARETAESKSALSEYKSPAFDSIMRSTDEQESSESGRHDLKVLSSAMVSEISQRMKEASETAIMKNKPVIFGAAAVCLVLVGLIGGLVIFGAGGDDAGADTAGVVSAKSTEEERLVQAFEKPLNQPVDEEKAIPPTATPEQRFAAPTPTPEPPEPTATPLPVPTIAPEPVVIMPTATPEPTPEPTAMPEPTPTPEPTKAPEPTPTPEPEPTPTPVVEKQPSAFPTVPLDEHFTFEAVYARDKECRIIIFATKKEYPYWQDRIDEFKALYPDAEFVQQRFVTASDALRTMSSQVGRDAGGQRIPITWDARDLPEAFIPFRVFGYFDGQAYSSESCSTVSATEKVGDLRIGHRESGGAFDSSCDFKPFRRIVDGKTQRISPNDESIEGCLFTLASIDSPDFYRFYRRYIEENR